MRAVLQRVTRARVSVAGEVVGEIGAGLCALVGVAREDTEQHAEWLASTVAGLRIFEDEAGKLNRSLGESGGALLAVSQFTLLGDARKGRRPSFAAACEPARAEQLFEHYVRASRELGLEVATGRFRTDMLVEIHNDGPVTLLLDSTRLF